MKKKIFILTFFTFITLISCNSNKSDSNKQQIIKLQNNVGFIKIELPEILDTFKVCTHYSDYGRGNKLLTYYVNKKHLKFIPDKTAGYKSFYIDSIPPVFLYFEQYKFRKAGILTKKPDSILLKTLIDEQKELNKKIQINTSELNENYALVGYELNLPKTNNYLKCIYGVLKVNNNLIKISFVIFDKKYDKIYEDMLNYIRNLKTIKPVIPKLMDIDEKVKENINKIFNPENYCIDYVFESELKPNPDSIPTEKEYTYESSIGKGVAYEKRIFDDKNRFWGIKRFYSTEGAYYTDPYIVIDNFSSLKTKVIYYQDNNFKSSGQYNRSHSNKLDSWSFEAVNSDKLIFKTYHAQYIQIRNDSVLKINKSCIATDKPNNNTYNHIKLTNGDDKDTMICEIGSVYLSTYDNLCTDTDIKKVKIITQNKEKIIIHNTRNLFIAEHDADGDKIKEIYIISHHSCSGRVEIIKIYE